MSRRKLTKEEMALWRKVADQADPLRDPKALPDALEPKPVDAGKRTKQNLIGFAPMDLGDFSIGQNAPTARNPHKLQVSVADGLRAAPVRMDKKTHARMKRGRLKPEARIDLHGMTVDRAHPALRHFIMNAQGSGLRLVLVITGKGRKSNDKGPIPVRTGILRHQVPQWLAMPPLSSVVLQVTPAHFSHGGEGALYVYLKRH